MTPSRTEKGARREEEEEEEERGLEKGKGISSGDRKEKQLSETL